jgi:predicted dehydrogenase
MPAKIRIGIIGTGGMANAHADNFKQIPGVVLTSCLDVVPGRAEAFAAKHGVPHVATSIGQLLEQVDAVSVVTPDRFHAAPSLAVLKAGKHLLCEKPLATSLAEARRMNRAARAAAAKGVVAMVNFSYRKSAAMQRAIVVARRGDLGALRHVHSFYLQSWLASDIWGHWSSTSLQWKLQKSMGSGGVLGDLGCHILDLTTAVAGDVIRARCHLANYPKQDRRGKYVTKAGGAKLDANDIALIELEFANGAIGTVQTSRWATGHANHLRLEVHGSEGALMLDLDRGYDQIDLCLGKDRQKPIWTTQTLKPTPSNWQRFIRAIRTGQPEQPDLERGAQVQAYLDACERSAASGKWEHVRSWS